MNSRERVEKAIAHRSTDRVPVFMWFHPDTAARLAALLEIAPSDVGTAMGNDVSQGWIGNNYAMEGIVHDCDGEGHSDFWGIEWERQNGFNQIVRSPLAGVPIASLGSYRFPHDKIPDLVRVLASSVRRDGDFFSGCDVSPCVFELLNRLFGMEETMLWMAENPPEFAAFVQRLIAFNVDLAEQGCAAHRPDWLWTGDDVGGRNGMMISPEMWREQVKPGLRQIVEVGLRRHIPVAFHSCGAIRPIIPDLIEIGISVLNPIQTGCPGMDPFELKNDFGKELTFMGGVDTIDLLPNGSVNDVRDTTRALIDHMASNGGYILAASHTVAPETPLNNIFAMYNEAGISREEIFDRAADLRHDQA